MSLRSLLTGTVAGMLTLSACENPARVAPAPTSQQRIDAAFHTYRQTLGTVFASLNKEMETPERIPAAFGEANRTLDAAYKTFNDAVRAVAKEQNPSSWVSTFDTLMEYGYFLETHHDSHSLCVQGHKVNLDFAPVYPLTERGTVTCTETACSYSTTQRLPGPPPVFDIAKELRTTQQHVLSWPGFAGNLENFSAPLYLLSNTKAAALAQFITKEIYGYVAHNPKPFQIVFKNGSSLENRLTVPHELTHALTNSVAQQKGLDKEALAYLMEFQVIAPEEVYDYLFTKSLLRFSPNYAFAATLPANLIQTALERAYQAGTLPELLKSFTPAEKDPMEFILLKVLRPAGLSSAEIEEEMAAFLKAHLTSQDLADAVTAFEKRIYEVAVDRAAQERYMNIVKSYTSLCRPKEKPVLALR